MRKIIPAVCSVLVALFVLASPRAACAQDLPNFTGKWSLDVAKSDFGPMPPPESMTYVIDHKEPALKLVSTQKGQQGEVTNERNVTTDGKDSVNKMRMPTGETEVKSTSKWVGKTLTTAFKIDVQGMALDIVESWKLSDDGKVLTVLREIGTDQGNFAVTTVFNKQ
jgi:hypothetical protein